MTFTNNQQSTINNQ